MGFTRFLGKNASLFIIRSFLSILVVLGLAHPVFAVGEFSADYTVEYAVSPQGVTIVTQKVVLTNKRSNLYPKQYAIVIDTDKIQNVIARDSAGVLTPDIVQHDGKTDITVTFNKQVVGVGNQLSFTIRYENLDFARQNGSIWEINIPGINDDPDLSSYSVSLQVPPSFGPNAYMSPLPADGVRWNKEQMVRGGISAAYGDTQHFVMNLSYYIENPKLIPVYTEVALPPDTEYQTVAIEEIDPAPTSMRRDQDGNWLARYDLIPGQKQTIHVKERVQMKLKPSQLDPKPASMAEYLMPLPNWESQDAKIKEIAATYKTPRDIYAYVVSTLSYDFSSISEKTERKGATGALQNPTKAICMEFTDLFIAIARAAGIPARENVGYAYTTNTKLRPLSLEGDILHAWPSYYDTDQHMWISVDPTWGNTTGGVNYFDKLDFNHITFAIHGLSSTEPTPAGFYRKEEDTTRNIQVDFDSENLPIPVSHITPEFTFNDAFTAGFVGKGTVTLKNNGNTAVKLANIQISAKPYPFTYDTTITNLPPHGMLSIPVRFSIKDYLSRGTEDITVSIDDKLFAHSVQIQPLYWLLIPEALLVLSLILVIIYMLKRK